MSWRRFFNFQFLCSSSVRRFAALLYSCVFACASVCVYVLLTLLYGGGKPFHRREDSLKRESGQKVHLANIQFQASKDVMGVARNIHKNPKLVPGGGATELTVSATLKAEEFICTRHRKGTNASKTAIEAACMLLRIDDIVSGIKKKQGVPCYS
ncbi:T-complex protein 1 subunit gamma [Linum perenne]